MPPSADGAALCLCLLAAYGAESNDRVHKSFFYGSKHIDQYVPKVDPNPRTSLMDSKKGEWATEMPPAIPANPDMYTTTAMASSMAYKGEKYVVR